MNELDKKRSGTCQMSERFGPNFAPGSLALQQSIGLVYTLGAVSRGRNRATRATRDNQDVHTQRKSTHTLGNGDTAQQPARDSEGELAAAAAAPPPPPPLLLLLCCCCFTTRDKSRSTTRHNRLFLVLCFLERTQERVTAQQQQQQQQQQQRQQQQQQ